MLVASTDQAPAKRVITMAASLKIEFDDGSRVISQTLEEASGSGVADVRAGSSGLSGDKRPSTCSIDDFYEVCMYKVPVPAPAVYPPSPLDRMYIHQALLEQLQ